MPFIDQSEYLSALIDDPRIDGVASALLGDDYNYETSDGNFYVGDTRWHSDGFARTKYRFLKFAFYLDPVTAGSGCLRVIPGSHHRRDGYANGLHKLMSTSRVDQTEEAFGVSGPEVPAVALETQPGDLIMFNQDLKHASYGGGTRRRMFTINVSERFEDEDLARCETMSPHWCGSGRRAPTARRWSGRRGRTGWCTWSSGWRMTTICRGWWRRRGRRWASRRGDSAQSGRSPPWVSMPCLANRGSLAGEATLNQSCSPTPGRP